MKICNYKSGSIHGGSNSGLVGYEKRVRPFKRICRCVICEVSIGLLVKRQHTSDKTEMFMGFWLEHLEEEEYLAQIGIVWRTLNGSHRNRMGGRGMDSSGDPIEARSRLL